MRGQGSNKAAKDDNGSKELVDLENRNTFRLYFSIVLINMSAMYLC